jgi:hypothetical protein
MTIEQDELLPFKLNGSVPKHTRSVKLLKRQYAL